MLINLEFVFVYFFSSPFYLTIFHNNFIHTSETTSINLLNYAIILLKIPFLHFNKLIPLNLHIIEHSIIFIFLVLMIAYYCKLLQLLFGLFVLFLFDYRLLAQIEIEICRVVLCVEVDGLYVLQRIYFLPYVTIGDADGIVLYYLVFILARNVLTHYYL